MKKKYRITGIDCANCAAKLEAKMNSLPEINQVTLTFATQQLFVDAPDLEKAVEALQKLADKQEPGTKILPLNRKTSAEKRRRPRSHDENCAGHTHQGEENSSGGHKHHAGDGCHCGGHTHQDEENSSGGHTHHAGDGCHCAGHTHQDEENSSGGHKHHAEDGCHCTGHTHQDEENSNGGHKHHAGDGCHCGGHTHQNEENSSGGHKHHAGDGCCCGELHHDHSPVERDVPWYKNTEVVILLFGAFWFVVGEVLEHLLSAKIYFPAVMPAVIYVVAYLLLGGEIVLTAVKNLFRGKVFDENFLMTIATIGAFIVGEFSEAVGVMLFYRIGELFEDIAVQRSRKQIMDAVDMRPEAVRLVEGDEIIQIGPEEIEIGDEIEIRPGDRIPLDGRVIRGESRIDTSAVTGEPVPIAVREGSQVLSGCVNTSGVIYLKVEKLLEDSMVSRILEAVENAAASKPRMDRFITKFARIYTPFVVLLALGTAVIPSLITGGWSQWIYTALTFLIISCPCALVLSVPLAFFAGIGAGSKKGILFKGGASLEMLADIKAVVMDKTGTITEGNFKVEAIRPASGYSEDQVLSFAAAAESLSTHPIAESIREAAAQRRLTLQIGAVPGQQARESEENGEAAPVPENEENKAVNLSMQRKPEEIQEISGEGMEVTLGGRKILCGNQQLLKRYNIIVPEKDISMSGTEVFLAENGTYAGCILINDMVKEDSKEAVHAMSKKGLYTAMLTGDTQANAEAVQKQTGIDAVFAKQMPEEKLINLKKIREEHGTVMFIGDGINDAPVLAGADVGAAMGSGADAAIEAADVVFMTSRLTALVESYDIAKFTKRIARENVIFALAVKIAVMFLGLCGIASMWMAVFADSGVAMLCVLNAIRALYRRNP